MKSFIVTFAIVFASIFAVTSVNAAHPVKISKGVGVTYSEGGSPDVALSLSVGLDALKKVSGLNIFDWSVGLGVTMHGSNMDVVEDHSWEKQYAFDIALNPSMSLTKDITFGSSIGYTSLNSQVNTGMGWKDMKMGGYKYGVSLSHKIVDNLALSFGWSETKWDKDDAAMLKNIEEDKTSGWDISLSYSF